MNSAAILIIDDEERLARNMASYLEREGHTVRMALSAEHGLAEVTDFRPDLVLLDLRLPGMDGMEALRRFRELDPDLRVGDVCPPRAYMADVNDPLDRILEAMATTHIGAVLVTRDAELAGIFTLQDACRLLAQQLRERHPAAPR